LACGSGVRVSWLVPRPRAAVEAAAAHREALRAGDKKEGVESWPKVKFDRQIVAIAKVEGAEKIYSNDDDIVRFAARDRLEVVTLEMLPPPPEKPQGELSFDPGEAPEPEPTPAPHLHGWMQSSVM
jgi:hypothetical protein